MKYSFVYYYNSRSVVLYRHSNNISAVVVKQFTDVDLVGDVYHLHSYLDYLFVDVDNINLYKISEYTHAQDLGFSIVFKLKNDF